MFAREPETEAEREEQRRHDAEAREVYLAALRRLTPEQRLAKAFELSELVRQLLWAGLRARHPEAGEEEIRRLYLQRLDACHNRNY